VFMHAHLRMRALVLMLIFMLVGSVSPCQLRGSTRGESSSTPTTWPYRTRRFIASAVGLIMPHASPQTPFMMLAMAPFQLRQEVETWLRTHTTSPLTGCALAHRTRGESCGESSIEYAKSPYAKVGEDPTQDDLWSFCHLFTPQFHRNVVYQFHHKAMFLSRDSLYQGAVM
jgi:hypothetical protein